jgi:hypothetical protein
MGAFAGTISDVDYLSKSLSRAELDHIVGQK